MKKSPVILILTATLLSSVASYVQASQSSTTVCTRANQTRIIEVVYPEDSQRPACEVIYTKQGNSNVLWSARNDMSYCEQKAMKFIAKQQGWGWDCRLSEDEQSEQVVEQKSEEMQGQLQTQAEQGLEEEKAEIEAEVEKIKQQREQAQ